ncbi:unnamed protein product [Closterium sp. Naga37s-1]|nr:unnamed protein product [Closterium sp. Naga37s-1]
MWYCPRPEGVAANAWQLLAIFLATIIGIITQPLPLGAVALMGLGVSVLTKTLTFAAAFSSFGDPIPWLIALAFFFAKGFINTGLGNRVGYQFVAAFGSTSLGLGYSLVLSEAMLAPAIPSVSARAGGIFLPLLKALCQACGSRTDDGTEKKLGAWLVLTCFQTSIVSSAMFLTGMAANPLAVNLAAGAIGHTIGWTEWAKAALVPGLISLAVVPALLYVIYPPEIKASPDAPKLAREKLAAMGPMSTNEKIMAGVLVGTVGLWVCGGVLGVDAVTAAIMGLSALLITGVVTWKECLGEGVAWDTLTWFAALIAMANYLNKYGLIAWFSQTVVNLVSSMGLAWQPAFGLLVILYFYSHYFFASGAAHIGAMFVAFISVASALGTPPLLAAMVLSFMSNLMDLTARTAHKLHGTDDVCMRSDFHSVSSFCRPSSLPSLRPSFLPSLRPSFLPSLRPSFLPSLRPSSLPSLRPSFLPSLRPSSLPSLRPSFLPSLRPSSLPSRRPPVSRPLAIGISHPFRSPSPSLSSRRPPVPVALRSDRLRDLLSHPLALLFPFALHSDRLRDLLSHPVALTFPDAPTISLPIASR